MILSLTDYKDYPEYDSTKTDAQTQIMLTRAMDDYRNIRGIPWRTFTATITNGSKTIEITSGDSFYYDGVTTNTGLQVGQPIYSDGQYGKIEAIDGTTITSDTNSTASGSVTLYVYPLGSRDTVAMMTDYNFSAIGRDTTIKSETIFKHSVTYDYNTGTVNGYPKNITSRIKRYASAAGGSIQGDYIG